MKPYDSYCYTCIILGHLSIFTLIQAVAGFIPIVNQMLPNNRLITRCHVRQLPNQSNIFYVAAVYSNICLLCIYISCHVDDEAETCT